MSNLESLHACNPSFVIGLQKEADCYIDLAMGRGENVVKRMRRAIALSPNKPTYQLLSGHIGSGKSTELLRLKRELEQQGFVVIYCEADQYLQIDDATELLLVILKSILQGLESEGESLSLVYLPNAIAEIEKRMRISSVGIITYGLRLQKILQALQDSNQNRRQLNYQLETRLTNLLTLAIEEVTQIKVDRLKQSGKKGLVVLVDNLDRLSINQAEMIFAKGGKYLRQFQCHTIYTFPLLAIAHDDNRFQQYGTAPILLPNLQICDRIGTVNPESLSLLRQVVLARMLPNLAPEKRLDQVADCFDNLETLDKLCLASHGHLTYLLSLLQGCLQSQDPPIDLETLNRVLDCDRTTRLSTVRDCDRDALQNWLTREHSHSPEALNLCRRLLLFEHHDDQGYWFSSLFAAKN
jgi:hypothetical protein